MVAPVAAGLRSAGERSVIRYLPATERRSVHLITDRVAALIAWLPIVRVDELVKDLRPPKAAALRAVLDKFINANRNAVQAIKAAF
jgi:hypothetical protein